MGVKTGADVCRDMIAAMPLWRGIVMDPTPGYTLDTIAIDLLRMSPRQHEDLKRIWKDRHDQKNKD